MNQYTDITAWKCMACGAVLTTEKGKENHLKRCKYTPPVIEGQMTFDKPEAFANYENRVD